ncbi:ABC transporter ATP-binding protein [Paenibacillus thermoaerophilus]|uniref:ABC transporter ATP-binding protein n=1 Tax=Paenibacillus thermoaerophilus TaxID=1215385 RepID=A0ABW2V152_9BACL|nr:ABC transporter ATP-binding protein [Paenibacillus thermoaerophilus]TMV07384.1 ABC transporter ATP-binding protein [Paenibacillus thermoaerophilus]
MQVLRSLKEYYWSHRMLLFGSLAFLLMATMLGLVYPQLLRILIDDVIKGEKFELVPKLALTAVGVIAVKASCQYIHGLMGSRLGNRVAYNLRNALYEKLQYLSFQYYDKAKTGDLMSRLTGDLDGLRNFVAFGFSQLCNMILMLIAGAAVMFYMNWKLTLITFAAMPLLAWTALKFERNIHPAFRTIRKAMSSLTTAVQENINGVRTVKAFAREPHEVEKFSRRSEEYRQAHIDMAYTWARYFPLMELLANASVVILILAGGLMVIGGSLKLGELGAFLSMIWYIIAPMRDIGFHINNYTQSKASGERVIEVLNQYVHVKNKENAVKLKPEEVKGHVVFEDVTFAYPDKPPALERLSLDAKPGSVIGLLGPTGAGKSTVIQLLMRAYNVKQGRILLDGQDIRDLDVQSLRSQIAVVFQETFLFSSTIRNNIAYGVNGATDADVERAARLAQAHDFISELPDGYDTIVGERGLGLSGGQKQRIAIARAILRNPAILILDDSTSAVDMETEHEIQTALREVMKGRTTFVIAHRISSLKDADEIIVLDKGRVVQRGRHEELVRQPGLYRQTYRIQYADHPDLPRADSDLHGERRRA